MNEDYFTIMTRNYKQISITSYTFSKFYITQSQSGRAKVKNKKEKIYHMHISNTKRVLLKDGHNKTIPTPYTNNQTSSTKHRQQANKEAGWGGSSCDNVTSF
jgi:hypothetical protein